MKKFLFIFSIISFCLFVGCPDKGNNPSDNKIDTVTICNQIWMKKNLDVDHYRNGDAIPEVRDPNDWANLSTGAWCNYNNFDSLGKIYGKLYNWYAVNDPRGLAPEGWHVPHDSDWKALYNCLGGDSIAGGKMKETAADSWMSPNTGATNESGFSALPGGVREGTGTFNGIKITGFWWSSYYFFQNTAIVLVISNNSSKIDKGYQYFNVGYSVRCLKNN